MREAGVVVDRAGKALHWHLPMNRSMGALPDSPDLWTVLRTHRDELLGFAHSHPGSGVPGPSQEDLTTFSAVERGLGRRLLWWITSDDVLIELTWRGPEALAYDARIVEDTPEWLDRLRAASKEDERR